MKPALVWTIAPAADIASGVQASRIENRYRSLPKEQRPAVINVKWYGCGEQIAIVLSRSGLPVNLLSIAPGIGQAVLLRRRGLMESFLRLIGIR